MKNIMIDAKAIKEFAEIDPAGLLDFLIGLPTEKLAEICRAINGEDVEPEVINRFIECVQRAENGN